MVILDNFSFGKIEILVKKELELTIFMSEARNILFVQKVGEGL